MNQPEKRKEFPPWIPPQRDGRRRGAWMNSLKLAKSQDGLHFEKLERTVVDGGGVPSMITDYGKGRIVAIFQYFSFEKEEEFDKIAISFSYDEGETWTKPQVVTFLGLPEPLSNTIDPTLVLLDDERYRLYFCYPQSGFRTSNPPRIYSAISDDCINFTVEEGVRVMVEGKVVNDPALIKIGDTWHYYSPVFTRSQINEQAINYHAVSKDGLNFTLEKDIVLDMKMLGSASAVEGGYRFYASRSAFSIDGYDWTQEDVKMPGPDPGVVKLKDGTYLLLYTAMSPNQ